MTKTLLQEALESAGYDCQSYSGRGMYGSTCLGVTLDASGKLGVMISDLLDNLTEEQLDDLHQISNGFRRMAWDSMGLGMIVYFPEVEYGGEEDS
jgi:hypothetical protein